MPCPGLHQQSGCPSPCPVLVYTSSQGAPHHALPWFTPAVRVPLTMPCPQLCLVYTISQGAPHHALSWFTPAVRVPFTMPCPQLCLVYTSSQGAPHHALSWFTPAVRVPFTMPCPQLCLVYTSSQGVPHHALSSIMPGLHQQSGSPCPVLNYAWFTPAVRVTMPCPQLCLVYTSSQGASHHALSSIMPGLHQQSGCPSPCPVLNYAWFTPAVRVPFTMPCPQLFIPHLSNQTLRHPQQSDPVTPSAIRPCDTLSNQTLRHPQQSDPVTPSAIRPCDTLSNQTLGDSRRQPCPYPCPQPAEPVAQGAVPAERGVAHRAGPGRPAAQSTLRLTPSRQTPIRGRLPEPGLARRAPDIPFRGTLLEQEREGGAEEGRSLCHKKGASTSTCPPPHWGTYPGFCGLGKGRDGHWAKTRNGTDWCRKPPRITVRSPSLEALNPHPDLYSLRGPLSQGGHPSPSLESLNPHPDLYSLRGPLSQGGHPSPSLESLNPHPDLYSLRGPLSQGGHPSGGFRPRPPSPMVTSTDGSGGGLFSWRVCTPTNWKRGKTQREVLLEKRMLRRKGRQPSQSKFISVFKLKEPRKLSAADRIRRVLRRAHFYGDDITRLPLVRFRRAVRTLIALLKTVKLSR
ncbi:hypothetical protein ACOMHN_003734 [Nucella lapillus]